MAQLNHSKFVRCPHCKMTVLPEANGTCPSCQRKIAESMVPVNEEETGIEELEIEGEETGVSEEIIVEGEAGEEELAEDENWLASEPEYTSYLQAAQQITRRFWGIVIVSITLSVLFLGAFAYFGFKNLFSGDTISAVLAFVIALAMPAMLVSFGIAQGNKTAEEEVSRSLLEFPGFDIFYELFRPHLRNRFWTERDENKAEIFLSIIKH